MNQKLRQVPLSDGFTCEKYLTRMLKEKGYSTKKSPTPPTLQEKFNTLTKQAIAANNTRPKSKNSPRQQSSSYKNTSHKEPEHTTKLHKVRRRSASRSRGRSDSEEREPWGTILHNNTKNHEKVSSFKSFDPLRTIHFLTKELQSKLQGSVPDEENMAQMLEDIQQALKRIPPEMASLIRESSSKTLKSKSSPDHEKFSCKPATLTKMCQTPPALSQDDTEKFQKIMEENTYRLEASCKQLETVCTNLQNEKEMTEKELEEARENVEFLCKRVKDLEDEMEVISNLKIKQLELEKQTLQRELEKATEEVSNNPTLNNLRRIIEELKHQKSASEELCSKLQYEMAIIKMENEKFVTMLNVRDREIKLIQEEMLKLQDQVNVQLSKLNSNVVKGASALRTLSNPDNCVKETGDGTISSIGTNETDHLRYENMYKFKERPCGGDAAELEQKMDRKSEEFIQKIADIKASDTEFNLDQERDNFLDNLLKGLSPSCEGILTSNNFKLPN